jgi:hypothetical protein
VVAYALRNAVAQQACLTPSAWPDMWGTIADPVRRFLAMLERVSRVPELAWRTELLLSAPRLRQPHPPGRSAVCVELTRPIQSVEVASGVLQLVCVGMLEGEALGLIDLPICDRAVQSSVIADAAAERWYWRALKVFLERRGLIAPGAGRDATWNALMLELWDGRAERALRAGRRSAVGQRFEVNVSEPLPELDFHGAEVDVIVRAGGRTVDVVRVSGKRRRISPETLRDAIDVAFGPKLHIAVAREALIGTDLRDPPPLRELLAHAADKRASSAELP